MGSMFRNLIIADAVKVKYDGLCFTAIDAVSTVSYVLNNGLTGIDVKKSTDGVSWSAWDGTAITLTNVGDKLYVKGNNAGGISNSSQSMKFVMTGEIEGSGNTNSLLDDGNGSTVTTIPKSYCFMNLFNNCSSLVTAPRLPATILKAGAYYGMFSGSGITIAPDLLATTLIDSCYYYMFENCPNLIQIKIGYTGNFSTDYTYGWVGGVNSAGIFYYNGSDTTQSNYAIPTNFVKTSF